MRWATLLLALVIAGCGAPAAHPADRTTTPPPAATATAPAQQSPRLPEDPVGAQIAAAQWRDHLAHEEHERRLGYDRRKLPEHREVMARIRHDRARYDHARSRTAVARVRAAMPASLADIRRRVQLIDHWGVNSNLLGDYAALLDSLATTYPAAREAALAGHRAPLEEARADWKRREKKISTWLEEAASSTEED